VTRIAYVMSHYPAVSHAFVLREVEAVRQRGIDIRTVSIHRARPGDLLAEADRTAASATFNLLPTGVWRLLGAHLNALLRRPARYLSTLGLALRTGEPGIRQRVWHVFYFAEAMILVGHCRRAQITHLHAQFADAATDVAMLVAEYERRPVRSPRAMSWSLAVHGSVEFYDVNRYAIAQKLNHATFAVAISDFGRSQLMSLSAPDRWQHIHVVRCGVDLALYKPPTARSGSQHRTVILCVGRLLRGKGLPLLFESVRQLRNDALDVTLTLVGDGPARTELGDIVRSMGLGEHVTFLGSIGQDQIRRVYADADIFCLPTFSEGIPVVAMEAMAMELPVVTTRIMGIPELIDDGRDGLLVSPGRVDELTAAIRSLVLAPAERRRLGVAGRLKVARDYDVHRSAQVMQSVLEDEIGLAVAGCA
jgi:glycosyltransferase involved in cell wall biosynthesis